MKMKLKFKFLTFFFLTASFLTAGVNLYAQNADFDESMFEDDTGFDSFENGSDFDSMTSSSFGEVLSSLNFSGNALMEARSYLDQEDTDTKDNPTSIKPEANLTASYANSSTEVEIKLNFSKDSFGERQ